MLELPRGKSVMSALTVLIIRHAEKLGQFWPWPRSNVGRLRRPEITRDLWLAACRQLVRVVRRRLRWERFSAARGDIRGRSEGHDGRRTEPAPVRNGHSPCRAAKLNTNCHVCCRGRAGAIGGDRRFDRSCVGLLEHHAIGDAILPAIAAGQTLPGMPEKWDKTRFDVVLRFDRSIPGAPWSFRQLFPRLLSGDFDVPMA